MHRASFSLLPLLLLGVASFNPSTNAEPLKVVGPLSPREELATFQIAKGFRVELVAAEPEVVDPVAMTFDEDGRLFVVEMRGYPNAGVGEGEPNIPGRVKLLEDKDGDGYFEKSTVYVDNLRFPTGVCCWRGGIIVANAPDLIYCKDTDGDGKADVRKVLYSGFGQKNIQQLPNSLQFHFDNWIHGCNGSNESVVRPVEAIEGPPLAAELARRLTDAKNNPVALRGRHFRFKPDVPGSLEPTSGGGQYGLASDDWGNWFTCTNSEHIKHIVLPDHYLKRNPHLAVPAVTHNIADGVDQHTAAAKVFRLSPFEPWRVDRTSRRAADPDYQRRLPATELVPGGFITSACSIIIYRGGAFPKEYDGNAFVCDPANNLIHRDLLVPDGVTFKAVRPDKDHEFLASTDNWFRPVFLTHGPDGALYLADFYREIIETPLSLPDDIQKRYNLNSRERGRIWRIASMQSRERLANSSLFKEHLEQLAALSALGGDAWFQLTAQRLLVERQRKTTWNINYLREALNLEQPARRIRALYALEGLGNLDALRVSVGIKDADARVREHSIRLAEEFIANDPQLRATVLECENDPSFRVRIQLALTLGEYPEERVSLYGDGRQGRHSQVAAALTQLALKDAVDPWMKTAILSSATPYAHLIVRDLFRYDSIPDDFLARMAALIGTSQTTSGNLLSTNKDKLETVLRVLSHSEPTVRHLMMLESMAPQLLGVKLTLAKSLQKGESLHLTLTLALKLAKDQEANTSHRLVAVHFLRHVPLDTAGPVLRELLDPHVPGEIQLAAVQSLSRIADRRVTDVLLSPWPSYSPAVRREVQEAVFARTERLPALLTAIEKGTVRAAQLDLARREQLLKHPNKDIRERATKLFAGLASPERKKVIEEHRGVLELAADPGRGKAVFKKNCATCHRLENEGIEVGPDLLSALKNKTKETLLLDLLDPSREVDPRYLNYIVQSKSGQVFTGLIAAETASSLVLRRAEKAEDTLLRSDIEEIQSTAKSVMPEGLEKQMTDQELADVIAYLLGVVRK